MKERRTPYQRDWRDVQMRYDSPDLILSPQALYDPVMRLFMAYDALVGSDALLAAKIKAKGVADIPIGEFVYSVSYLDTGSEKRMQLSRRYLGGEKGYKYTPEAIMLQLNANEGGATMYKDTEGGSRQSAVNNLLALLTADEYFVRMLDNDASLVYPGQWGV